MVSLDERIAQWRRALADAQCGPTEVVDELEGHLRDEIARLVQDGQPEDRAFASAVASLGSPEQLATEFARNLPPAQWPLRLAIAISIVWTTLLGGLLLARFGEMNLLMAHVGAITLGYTTTLFVGVLAAGYVVCRLFGTPSPRQVQGLTRATLYLSGVAFIMTAAGVLLGGVWAQDHLGRFWAWDLKETGGLLVMLWNAAMLAILGRQLLGEHRTLLLGFAGNAIVAAVWFGPVVVAGSTAFTLPLAVFLVGQAAMAGLGLAPARCFRRRVAEVG